MKRVFTCNNALELQAYSEELNRHGIGYFIKNEYIAGAIGEIPFAEALPELWVINDTDAPNAKHHCQKIEQQILSPKAEWCCRHCGEYNGGNFEYCWQCEHIAHLA